MSICSVSACPEFTGHVAQAAEPIAVLYWFAGHAVHVSPSLPVYPALHRQLVKRLLPLEEIEFTGQSLHAAEPVLCL